MEKYFKIYYKYNNVSNPHWIYDDVKAISKKKAQAKLIENLRERYGTMPDITLMN